MFASPARSHDPRHTPASKRAAHASSSAKDQHGAQSPARDLDATPKPAPGARRALHLGSQTGEPADAEFDTAAGALETSVYETAMSDLQSKVEQLQVGPCRARWLTVWCGTHTIRYLCRLLAHLLAESCNIFSV